MILDKENQISFQKGKKKARSTLG